MRRCLFVWQSITREQRKVFFILTEAQPFDNYYINKRRERIKNIFYRSRVRDHRVINLVPFTAQDHEYCFCENIQVDDEASVFNIVEVVL